MRLIILKFFIFGHLKNIVLPSFSCGKFFEQKIKNNKNNDNNKQ